MSASSSHPPPEVLRLFAVSLLPEDQRADVESHVLTCAACGAIAAAASGGAFGVQLRQAGQPAPEPTQADKHTGALPLVAVGAARLADYEINRELNRGGMGVVYLAHHKQLNHGVAIKMILAGALATPAEEERFLREGELLVGLNHPNVVRVFDCFRSADQLYLVMEYESGGSLADSWHAVPQPVAEAAATVETLARAAQFVHRKGIIHRDLKPANVLLSADGTPRIADFGLAKRTDVSAGQTSTGAVLGTPRYMAPEQARGHTDAVGPAADIYALGVILYEAITGRVPFQGSSPVETLKQVVEQEPVPPRRLIPHCPADLDTICLKCLEKDPGRRYATAADLAEDLRLFRSGEPIHARPVGRIEYAWRWSHRNPAATGVMLLVVALVVLLAVYALNVTAARQVAEHAKQQADDSAERLRSTVSRLQVMQAARAQHEDDLLASLPWLLKGLETDKGDAEREKAHRIRLGTALRQCPDLEQLFIHGDRVAHLEFSPDGQLLLTASWDHTARLWDTATGQERAVLKHNGPVLCAAFNRAGDRIVTGSDDKQVRVWDAATGRNLHTLDLNLPAASAAFSPDGKWIAAGGGAKGQLTRWQVLVSRVPGPGGMGKVIRNPQETAVKVWTRVWDAETGKVKHQELKQNGWISTVAFHPSGTKLLTAGVSPGPKDSRHAEVNVWDVASSQWTAQIVAANMTLHDAAWSPDGNRIVTATGTKSVGKGSVQTWDTATGDAIGPPLAQAGEVVQASFSPNGRRLLTASEEGVAGLWDVDTGQSATPPLRHNGRLTSAQLSTDGQLVLTTSWDATARVWEAANGTPVTPVLRHGCPILCGAFSARARLLATADVDGLVRLWRLPAEPRLLKPPHPVDGPKAPLTGRIFLQNEGGVSRRIATCRLSNETIATAALFHPRGTHLLAAVGRPLLYTLHADGSELVGHSTFDDYYHLWELNGSRHSYQHWLANKCLDESWNRLTPAALSPDGQQLLLVRERHGTGGWEAAIRATFSGQPLSEPRPLGGPALAGQFTPEGVARLALLETTQAADAAKRDPLREQGKVQVWEWAAADLRRLCVLNHSERVNYARFVGAGQLLLTVSATDSPTACTAHLCAATTGAIVAGPVQLPGAVHVASSDLKGERILLALRRHAQDRETPSQVMVWEPASGRLMAVNQHRGVIHGAELSPDGRLLVTASADGTACLWDAASGQLSSPPLVHRGAVLHAAFNREGTAVLTACQDGTTRAWSAQTGEALTPPLKHSCPVQHVAFQPAGHLIAAAERSGSVRLWDLSPEPRAAAELQPLVSLLACSRIDDKGRSVPLDRTALIEQWRQHLK